MDDPVISTNAWFCVNKYVQFAIDNGYRTVSEKACVYVLDPFDDNGFSDTLRIDVRVCVGDKVVPCEDGDETKP